jgi:AcrR family transcriptional regulator
MRTRPAHCQVVVDQAVSVSTYSADLKEADGVGPTVSTLTVDRSVCIFLCVTIAKAELSVRERLLAAANELFYAEGIHTVGIDRVLERAGVAKASLYGTFGSKDELVRAYLQERGRNRRERIVGRIARAGGPRDSILGIFELLDETARRASFRGCPFVNACAEGAAGPSTAREVSAEQRRWLRDLFANLAADLGVADPDETGRQLALLYDGAIIVAAMDGDAEAPLRARALAEHLLDAKGNTTDGSKASKRTVGVRRGNRSP